MKSSVRLSRPAANPSDAPLNCTCGRLRKLTRRMTSFYEQHLRQTGLKLSQYSVLTNISDQQQSLVQLAARLEMDRTTLTRSLKPLMQSGWVTEVPSGDARARMLVLTPEGQIFRQKVQERWADAQLALEARLGRDVVADLNTHLEQILAQLKPVMAANN